MRRSFNPSSYNSFKKSDKSVSDVICFNCERPGHFAAECNRPKKDDIYRRDENKEDRYKKEERYKRDEEADERNVERSKDKSKDKFRERSKDRRMRSRGDKRPSRKHDRKVLVAEVSTKSWADTDSESSSSSSSSSDSEQEEVHCLMADQTSDDEIFDFSNVEFTREDLVTALNDMVKEYRKLSHSFEEAKAENMSLKSSSIESSSDELEDIDSLKTELNKTVHRYISINDKVGVEEAVVAPPMNKASRKPAASKKRPAVAAAEEPVPKKKRTSKKKSGSSPSILELVVVAQEAVPIQMVEPSTGVPTAEEPVEQPVAEDDISADQPVDKVTGVVDGEEAVATEVDASADRDQPADITDERQWFDLSHEELIAKWAVERQVITPDDTDEEIEAERPVFESVAAVEPVVEVGEAAADKYFSLVDDPDTVINQVLNQLDSNSDDKDDKSSDRAETWFDRALDEMLRTDSQVVTPNGTNEEMETVVVGVDSGNQPVQTLAEKPVEEMVTVMGDQATTAIGDQQVCSGDELSEDFETEPVVLSADEAMSLEDIFMSIPADIQLPSAGVEITRILFGATIHISGVTERTWYLASLPKIPVEDKGKELLVEKDPVKGNPVWEQLVLIVAEIELLVQLREKVINEVEQFFHSFSRKKLAALQLEDVYTKVEQVLTWAGTDSPIIALHRKRYILMKSLSVVEPVFRVAPRQSPVFALRISQFCSVFIDYSLFSWLPTADITDFLSSIALDRTVFRSTQIAQNIFSVAPHVQLLDEPSSSSSSDESMNFDDTPASISLPATASTTPDVTEALNQLRASIDQICEGEDGSKHRDTMLLHLHNFEKQVIARLDAQDRVLGALRRDSNDQRNLLSLELQSSHKQLGNQLVTTGLDVVDVQRVVGESHQELNARINSLDEQVAATRHDLLEFSAQAQQTLSIITSQLSELVAYINRGGDNKKGESSHRPLPTPIHQSEGTGDAVRITEPTRADIDNANRAILERIRNEDSLHAERERDRERRERRLSRSGAYKRRRGY
ncbi:hypothetical protein F511_26517 [Dorcoceras hygrometricum]|uniref:CCHC-type domain-containing protein n=1 Tax=Dorcoceras hygrometricum TaxID=472368 RepID=A0A2Z7DGJ9_9LAMI|nr:hypothetical protein F511_26517 [Dorcoceras hygrometricum]